MTTKRNRSNRLTIQSLEQRCLLTAVVSVSPLANAHVAASPTQVSATFDIELQPDTISENSFVVHGMQTGVRKQTPSVTGNDITLSPTRPFLAGELVQATATRQITGLGGAPPAQPFVWHFREASRGGTGDFTKESGRSLGFSNTLDVAVGDVDGDGDLDAVAVSNRGNALWINDGSGRFSHGGENFGGVSSNAVALGDVDSDGDLDVVFGGNYGGQQVFGGSVTWINNGLGQFTDGGQPFAGTHNRDVALGDVDSDGDLDLFLASGSSGKANEVWLNDGFGNFRDSGQRLGDDDSQSVALEDLDGDGDLDAYVANGWYDDVADKVWLNDGNGTFRDSEQILSSTSSRGVALGDVDGDGDLDALVQSFQQPNTLWLNDGNGVFLDSGQDLGTGEAALADLRDFDGDGDLDARLGSSFWRNDGLGTFADTLQALDGRATAYGDLDGDGDLDEFAGRNGSNKVRLNDGTGIFNEDGKTLADGHGSTGFHGYVPFGDVEIGDLDGDGDLDAFVAEVGFCGDTGCNRGAPNTIWFNDGNGRFHDSGQRLGDFTSRDVALGDLDGDGDLDAIVANDPFGSLRTHHSSVWLNDGQGKFSNSEHNLVGEFTSVKLGDVDGDGDLDAVLGKERSREPILVLLNDGSGTFVRGQSISGDPTDVIPRGVRIHHLGDYDADGDLDGLFGDHIWLNDSEGNFTNSGRQLASESKDVAFGDLDGDGDVDAYLARGFAPNAIWLNDGNGLFADSGQELGTAESISVRLGDIDGDDDLDAFVTNSSSTNKVWLNDGLGNFRDSGQDGRLLGASSLSGILAMGDLDADGDLDVIVDNRSDLKVLINQDLLPGDSNRDGIFNSADLVAVFQAGEFEDDVPNNSTFDEGDWNGDGDFDSSDLVLAFQAGHYSFAARKEQSSNEAAAHDAILEDVEWRSGLIDDEGDLDSPFVWSTRKH